MQLTDGTGTASAIIPRTSHDQFLLHGTLSSGAVLSYHLRGGPAFANTSGHIWRIYGTKGEIQVTGPDSYLQITDDNVKIELFDAKTGEVEDVKVGADGFSSAEMPLYARNIARLYEAFADGKGLSDGVLDWEEAVKRHYFVNEVYKKAGLN